jgi:16S rRNA (cytidine1402-2'-O)-methyltransferase
MNKLNKPALYLIPTAIGTNDLSTVIPKESINALLDIKFFLVENIRSARRFLKAINYLHHFDEVEFVEMDKHNNYSSDISWMEMLRSGESVGLLSEAGVPCIADPGHHVVMLAHQNNITVVPLGGPSSIIKALMASGLNGQQFTFHGYLPVNSNQLSTTIKAMEKQAKNGYTQIFIETPYRNQRLFDNLMQSCCPHTLLCVASGIDSENQQIRTKTIAQWTKTKESLKGIPVVFVMGV